MLNYSDLFKKDYESPVHEKYEEIYNTMSVYLQSKPPTHIFEQRRPLESKNNSTLEHRQENHRNFLKDKFDISILRCIESAQGIDAVENYTNNSFKEFIGKKTILVNGITLTLNEYITNNLFKYSENDPNSIAVVMPKHPTDRIEESGFITEERIQLPNFDNITNKNIDLELVIVSHREIRYVDNERLIFRKGSWLIGDKYYDYYCEVSMDSTTLWIPQKDDKGISYVNHFYYNNSLSILPFVFLKNNFLQYEDNGVEWAYNVSHFYAATLLGDMIYGQQSDLMVTAIRHVYPIKTQIKTNCTNVGYHTKNGVHCHIETGVRCLSCEGKGYTLDESPYGTILVDARQGTENEVKTLSSAVTYTSPDTAPMTFNKEYIKELKVDLDAILGFTNQNNTNASAESKQIDKEQRISRMAIIVKDILRVKESIIRVMENFYTLQPPTYTLKFDGDFDIQTANDLATELQYAKESKMPIEVIRPIVKKIYLKKNGKTIENDFIVDFLEDKDMLFGYNLDELQTLIAVYGSMIGQREMLIHAKGEVILKDIIKGLAKDEMLDLERITTEFETRINSLIPQLI